MHDCVPCRQKTANECKNIILSFILHNFAKNCGIGPTNDILMLQTTILTMRKTYMIRNADSGYSDGRMQHTATTRRQRAGDGTLPHGHHRQPHTRGFRRNAATLDVEYMEGAKGALRTVQFCVLEYFHPNISTRQQQVATWRNHARACRQLHRSLPCRLCPHSSRPTAAKRLSTKRKRQSDGARTPAREATIVARHPWDDQNRRATTPPAKLTRAVNIDTAKADGSPSPMC